MIPEEIKQEARKELARRDFWEFEKLLYPELFYDERKLLKQMAQTIQSFIEDSDKHYLVLSVPPGHFKSFTAKNLALWLMGKDPTTRVIGVANSGDLASMFSTQIRDTILGINIGKGGVKYPEIFPDTKIKYGFATKSKWELEGSSEPSYRATSPTSAITGSRADYFIVDDIIKNYTEAMNANALKDHFEFYKNTLFSRTDGDKYKFIFVMQRWATNDLSGEIMNLYGDDVVVVNYEIEDKDGNMLEPTIMSRKKFEEAKKTLDPNVLKANYYQEPVNIEGRLYNGFEEWITLPATPKVYNTTDVADQGKDYLCSINWIEVKEDDTTKVYITDVYYSNEKAEITEPQVAKMITAGNVTDADFESNNGGKGYARNIERELRALGNQSTQVTWTPQTANKEARILASSSWVARNVYMPPNWSSKYPEFAGEVLSYVAGGKNPHDDACFPAGTMIATTKGDVAIEKIKVGDKVITPIGVREVTDSMLTGKREVMTRQGITATPNHKVWDGKKFTRLDVLTGNYDVISMSGVIKWTYKKLLYSMDNSIDSWGRENITLASQQQIKEGSVLRDFIGRFGNIILERKYQKAIKFTILMATHLITTIATYSVYQLANTLKYTWHMATGVTQSLLSTLGKKLLNGTKANREGSGTENRLLKNGSILKERLKSAYSALKNISLRLSVRDTAQKAAVVNTELGVEKRTTVEYAGRTSQQKIAEQSIVQKSVKQPQCVNVYNITVKEAGCYYADGVLVSNCDVLATIYDRVMNVKVTQWATADDM